MTTEQRMLFRGSFVGFVLAMMVAMPALSGAGCATTSRGLRLPTVLVSPYGARDGDVIWAVAPPRNESGVSAVDPLEVADAIAATIQEVRGISAVPVNRTLAAMRALGMERVESAADARRVALAMGVDGVIVGTISAWDPYEPPSLGMSLALYGRPGGSGRLEDQSAEVDPRALTSAARERRLPSAHSGATPLSTVSEHLDASNHAVLAQLRAYAEGRNDPTSALGWRSYLASMTLFTKFASHRLAAELLDKERLRLARGATEEAMAHEGAHRGRSGPTRRMTEPGSDAIGLGANPSPQPR